MERLRKLRERVDIFDLLSLGLILLLTGLALAWWSKYPVHMDSYYHMGVTSGFAKAGGIALHSFWEYAPAGRAQLYPPLLHVIMYGLTKTGLSTLSVMRLVTFSSFPLLLLSGWYGMRTLYTRKAAFYTTVVLSSVYLLFWHSAVESAAALVLILTPLIFVAVDRDRKVAAAVLLALALYSHLTLGHLVALGLLIYAVHRRQMFKEIAIVLVGAYALWLPWGIHILLNYKSLSFSSPGGGTGQITVHVLVWLVALAGFVYCYFKKGKYYLLPAFLLGFVPIVFFYPDRFWNAHVFLPLAMLGGVALGGLHDFVGARMERLIMSGAARKAVLATVMAVPVVLLLLVDPVVSSGGGMGPGGGRPPAMAAGQTRSPSAQQGTGSAISTGGPTGGGTATTGGESARAMMQPPPMGDGTALPPLPGQPPTGANQAPGGMPNPPDVMGGPGGAQGGPPGGMGGPGRRSGLSASSTTLMRLLGSDSGRGGMQSISTALIDSSKLQLASIIEKNSTPEAIVYINDGSIGNLITGLTGRASTGGMFHEVSPTGGGATVASAQNASIIVVSAQGQGGIAAGPMGQQAAASLDTSGYELVGTAGNYKVYKNTTATATSSNHGTVIPWWAVYSLLGLMLVAAGVDWFRRGPRGSDDPSSDGAWERRPVVLDDFEDEASVQRKEVLAIVPCYNEAGNVGSVVEELRSCASFLDVVVVDDGSSDGSADEARRAGAHVISRGENGGIGASVRTGMAYALDHGYRFAVQVDADGQHDTQYISSLIGLLEDGSTDVVVGSRFLGVCDYRPPLARRVGIKLLAWVVSLVSGRRATDTTSGFRAMNRRALKFLVANYPDDYPESESLVLMGRAGIRWTETPVAMRARKSGVSSIRGLSSATYMAKVLGSIALDTLGLKTPHIPADAA